MAKEVHKPEEMISKLSLVEVLNSQGMAMVDAIRQIGLCKVTFYHWRKEYGGMKTDQLKRLKEFEKSERAVEARGVQSDATDSICPHPKNASGPSLPPQNQCQKSISSWLRFKRLGPNRQRPKP